jgi:two-component system CheB/CheR fusion protein
MADNAPVMMWVVGADKTVNFFNRTWLEYKGRDLEQEKQNGWGNGIYREDFDACRNTFNRSFAERIPFTLEYRLRRYDGEYRWVLDIGKPTFSPEGNFTGFIGTCTEIHDKKVFYNELEQKVKKRTLDLQEINEELARSNSELQQFAYVASHDLQEPLRKIISFSDRLNKYLDSLPPPANTYIEKISASAQRMTRLIDDLLNFSRISRNARKFVKTDLNEILKEVLVDFELIISQKKAVIKSDELPSIQAIPIQMEQLFHNLISNSLKFSSPETPPVISILVERPDQEEIRRINGLDPTIRYINLIFDDNGIGFDPAYAELIFTIFQRLHEKQDFPGTGIGLALCRKIVNNHRGEIFAFSKEGRGSSFHVILPEKQP